VPAFGLILGGRLYRFATANCNLWRTYAVFVEHLSSLPVPPQSSGAMGQKRVLGFGTRLRCGWSTYSAHRKPQEIAAIGDPDTGHPPQERCARKPEDDMHYQTTDIGQTTSADRQQPADESEPMGPHADQDHQPNTTASDPGA